MESINYSWDLAVIGLGICMIMLLISKPSITYYNPKNNNIKKGISFFFILYILNSIFAFWEWDTYHSWGDFKYARSFENFEMTSYEPVYNWLASITHYNYFIWRAVIWVPTCLLIFHVGKKLNLLNRNLLVSLVLFCVFTYSARNLLGIVLLLLGAVMIFDSKTSSRIIGILLIVASYYFHKSMFITILFAILSLLPQNKMSITVLIVLFPLATQAAGYIINHINSGELLMSLGETDYTVYLYVNQERVRSTSLGILRNIIILVPQYLTLIYVTKRIFFDNMLHNDKYYKIWYYLGKLSFITIYIASTFYFTNSSIWIYERFKYMGIIPLTFVLAKIWSIEPRSNFWIKSIILLQLLSLSYKWLNLYIYWA